MSLLEFGNKAPQTGHLDTRGFYSRGSDGWKSKVKVSVGWFLPETGVPVPFCSLASGGASNPGCSAAHITAVSVSL